jgi:hypothetical protein
VGRTERFKAREAHLEERMVAAIQDHVGWFNGWSCSREDETESIRKGLRKAMKIFSAYHSLPAVIRDTRGLAALLHDKEKKK